MSQKKSLSSSRSRISSPSVNQLPQVDMGTTGLRLDTGRVLGLQLSSPVWLLGNTCRHSQGGEDSLLGPLPHLSPFTLQPVKWSRGEPVSWQSFNTMLLEVRNVRHTILPAHALLPPLPKRKTTLNHLFILSISELTHTEVNSNKHSW